MQNTILVKDFKEKSGQTEDQKNYTRALPKLLQVEQLTKIFENKHNNLRVTKVWFLKKKDKGDGFKTFHYNYKDVTGGRNDVSFTVVIILGKLNDASKILIHYDQIKNHPH